MRVIATGWKDSETLLNNYRRNRRAFNALGNFGLKGLEIVMGSYEGVQEMGISFSLPSLEGLTEENVVEVKELYRRVRRLFFETLEQESILFIRDNRESYLLFKDGEKKHLGFFLEVEEERALREKAFSYINGEFFITLSLPRLYDGEDAYLEAEVEI